MKNRFHCCATCIHFAAEKKEKGGMAYRCVRLGYETKPFYTFTCWEPTVKVNQLMKKDGLYSS